MLRWANTLRMVRIPQRAYCTVNSSAANEDVEGSKKSLKSEPKVANQSQLVAAAFASLKELSTHKKQRPSSVDIAIDNARNANELLETAEEPITRSQALKIVSKLTDWACMGRIRLTDYETDSRFVKVCRLLGQSGKGDLLGDLSVVLNVTADEQAAKLVSSISVPQMIRVMNSLAAKKRRSPPLLRSLSFHIGKSSEVLSLKQAADVFYACAALNFHDEVLLAKVTADISASLKDNKIPSVVSSIATSAGIMKYRDTDLFEDLCNWMAGNTSVCKTKDYISLVLALASINYIPEKFSFIYKHLKPYLKEQEMNKVIDWVDVVWSLVVLQRYGENTIQSVLNPEFIDKLRLQSGDIHISTKMKLLNINGIAQQLASKYEGPLLPEDSDIFDLPLVRMKEKQKFVDCVKDTLSNIVNVSDYCKLDVNTGMGFLIDIECYLNEKSELIPLSYWPNEKGHKVAIMTCMYHDVCRGSNEEITGIVALNFRLLENADYKVLVVPFYEFSMRDALINRVEYVRKKLKNLINK